jgi:hypothetical protein
MTPSNCFYVVSTLFASLVCTSVELLHLVVYVMLRSTHCSFAILPFVAVFICL